MVEDTTELWLLIYSETCQNREQAPCQVTTQVSMTILMGTNDQMITEKG